MNCKKKSQGVTLRTKKPLLASRVSKSERPEFCAAASSALRRRLASSSTWAASHSSERSIGASVVPPETNPEDIVGDRQGLGVVIWTAQLFIEI